MSDVDGEAEYLPRGTRPRIAEIDLMDLVRDIWNAKYTIATLATFSIFLALLSLAFSQKTYTATAVLGPAESSAQSGLRSELGQYAGAANLLGMNIGPSAGGTDFTKFKTLLTSTLLAEELYRDESLRTHFFGPGWQPRTRSWKRPTGIVFEIKDFLKGILGLPRWKPPTPFTLQDSLKMQLGVASDKLTGFLTVTVSDTSPSGATGTLKAIINKADGLIRQSVKDRSTGRITYLNTLLQQTPNADQRQAMINVLSSQQKIMMMTSADKTYAVDVIDPPGASPIQTSPKPSTTVMSYFLTVVSLASLWAVLRGHFYVRSGQYTDYGRQNPSLDAALRDWIEYRWNRLLGRRSGHAPPVQEFTNTYTEQ